MKLASQSTEQPPRRAAAPKLPKATSNSVFAALLKMPALERIQLVRQGIPARWSGQVSKHMAMPKERFYRTIGVSKATMTRKIDRDQRLSLGEGERVVGVALLLGQVEAMVAQSGDAQGFDAAAWMARWMDRPQPALGGQRPGDLVDTADGRALVSDLLARMQSGAYG